MLLLVSAATSSGLQTQLDPVPLQLSSANEALLRMLNYVC